MLFIHLLTKNYTQVEYRGTSAKRGGKVYIILRCDQQIITGSNHRSEKGFFFHFYSLAHRMERPIIKGHQLAKLLR